MSRKLGVVCASLMIGLLALALMPAAARATYGPTAQFQIGLSGNCFNPSLCGPAPGVPGIFGFWGWIALNTDHSGDGAVTDYRAISQGQPLNPSNHQIDITSWSVSLRGTFVISGAVSNVGPGASFFPPILTGFDTGIPAFPGHFSMNPAPGVSFQFQVTQLG